MISNTSVPYHKGNSPTKGVGSYVDQKQIWIPCPKAMDWLVMT